MFYQTGGNKELLLKKVGINQASVFHGFCKEHDQLFQGIDINGICNEISIEGSKKVESKKVVPLYKDKYFLIPFITKIFLIFGL